MGLQDYLNKLKESPPPELESASKKGLVYLLTDIIDLGNVQAGFKDFPACTQPNYIRKFLLGFLRWRTIKGDKGDKDEKVRHKNKRVLDFQQKKLDIRIFKKENDLSLLLAALGYDGKLIAALIDLHYCEDEFENFVIQLYDELRAFCWNQHFKIFFDFKSLGKTITEVEMLSNEKMKGVFNRFRIDRDSQVVKVFNRSWTQKNMSLMKKQGVEAPLFNFGQVSTVEESPVENIIDVEEEVV